LSGVPIDLPVKVRGDTVETTFDQLKELQEGISIIRGHLPTMISSFPLQVTSTSGVFQNSTKATFRTGAKKN
jgi:hypothetical protein